MYAAAYTLRAITHVICCLRFYTGRTDRRSSDQRQPAGRTDRRTTDQRQPTSADDQPLNAVEQPGRRRCQKKSSKKSYPRQTIGQRHLLPSKRPRKSVGENCCMCCSCGYGYGHDDDPLIEDQWFLCTGCKKWSHESCGKISKAKFICNVCCC